MKKNVKYKMTNLLNIKKCNIKGNYVKDLKCYCRTCVTYILLWGIVNINSSMCCPQLILAIPVNSDHVGHFCRMRLNFLIFPIYIFTNLFNHIKIYFYVIRNLECNIKLNIIAVVCLNES